MLTDQQKDELKDQCIETLAGVLQHGSKSEQIAAVRGLEPYLGVKQEPPSMPTVWMFGDIFPWRHTQGLIEEKANGILQETKKEI